MSNPLLDERRTRLIQSRIDAGLNLDQIISELALFGISDTEKDRITTIYNEINPPVIQAEPKPPAPAEPIIYYNPTPLRDYQAEVVKQAMETPSGKCFIDLPTGAGKTLVMYNFIDNFIRNHPARTHLFLILSPRIKLSTQHVDSAKLRKEIQHDFTAGAIAIINSKSESNVSRVIDKYQAGQHIIMSGTYQSIDRVKYLLQRANIVPSVVFNDEAHMISTWTDHIETNPARSWLFSLPKIIHMTATPTLGQKSGLPEYWGQFIRCVSIGELINRNILCEIATVIPNIKYNAETMEMDIKHLCLITYKTVLLYGCKKAVMFCNTQAKCVALYREFEKINRITPGAQVKPFVYIGTVGMGLQSHASGTPVPRNSHPLEVGLELSVDGKSLESLRPGQPIDIEEADIIVDGADLLDTDDINTTNTEDIKAYEGYNTGPAILFTCKKISMGYDHPPIDFIGFADPKCSRADISQCVGRGLRVCPGKTKCYVFIPITPADYSADLARKKQHDTLFEYFAYIKTDVGFDIEDTMAMIPRHPEEDELQQQINPDQVAGGDAEEGAGRDGLVPARPAQEPALEYINPEQLALILLEESVYRGMEVVSPKREQQTRYNYYASLVKRYKFKSIQHYLATKPADFPDNPEFKFNLVWQNWYTFLNIDAGVYPSGIDTWRLVCERENIRTLDDYMARYDTVINPKLPHIPEEIYRNFKGIARELRIDEDIIRR